MATDGQQESKTTKVRDSAAAFGSTIIFKGVAFLRVTVPLSSFLLEKDGRKNSLEWGPPEEKTRSPRGICHQHISMLIG